MRLLFCIAALLCMTMIGCESQPVMTTTEMPSNVGLLYELVSKQKQVGMILIIKSIPEPTAALVRDIADASKDATQTLESLADKNALKQNTLPPLEQAVRDAIEAHQRKVLLTAGDDAELRLLLTQTQATQYAQHLAEQLALQWSDNNAKAKLNDMAARFKALNARTIDRLAVKQLEQ